MIRVGAIYVAPWGRYRVHRVRDREVVLVDLANLGAAVIVAIIDLSKNYTLDASAPAAASEPARGMPESPQPQSSAGSAQNEQRGDDRAGAPPFGRLVPDGGESFRATLSLPEVVYTLGAIRPGGSCWSVPDLETFYWRPCIRPTEIGEGGGPHCHFITSNLILSIYCPTCRPDRARIELAITTATPAGVPEATALPGSVLRHPDDVPVWERVGGARGTNLLEWWEERAAIIEEACHVDRATAEREAYQMLTAKLAEHHGATTYTSATESAPPEAQRRLF